MKNNIYTAIPDWFNKVQSQSTDNTSTTTTQTTIIGGGSSISMSVHNLFIKSDTTITIDDFTISDLFVTDQITDTENWLTTPLLHTLPNTEVSVTTAAQLLYIGAYDKNNNQIKLYQFLEAISTVVIPENCYYLRASSNKTNTDLTIKYVGLNNFDETQLNKLESSSFQNFLTLVEGDEKGVITNSVLNLSLVFQDPLYYTLDKAGNVLISIDRDALFSQGAIGDIVINGSGNALVDASLSEDHSVITFTKGWLVDAGSDQSITGIKDFINGIKLDGQLIKIVDGVLFLDCSIAATGGITAYATMPGEGSSSIMDQLVVDTEYFIITEEGVLTIVPGSVGGISNIYVTGNGNALTTVTLSEDGKTVSFTKDKSFADQAEMSAYKVEVNQTITNFKNEVNEQLKHFVTLDTEQEITAIKHFIEGITIGSNKHKFYEKDGVLWLEGDIAITGGITTFARENADVTTIMDGVVVDEVTITKGSDNVLRIKNAGAGSSFDKSAMWTALAGSTTEQINKSHLTTALTGYATESWVSGKNYAVKATTLAGYGITDAYTKTESNGKYPTKTGSGASGTWGINISGTASNADKLDNYDETDFFRARDYISYSILGNFVSRKSGTYCVGYSGYSGLLTVFYFGDGSTSAMEILAPYYDPSRGLQLRYAVDDNRFTSWRSFAFEDGNIASATKLQTARNIWGISFDGTKDITGNITLGNYDIIGYNGTRIIQNLGENLGINPNGNVGIGNTTPQHKLHVSGVIFSSSEIKCQRYVLDDIGATGLSPSDYFLANRSSIRFADDIAGVRQGTFRPIIRWGDAMDGIGYNTRYVFGSVRDNTYDWGRIFMAVSNNDAGTSTGCSFSIYGAGYVEITGNILATGGCSFYGSDIRYKSIIQQVKLSLSDIAKAPSFVYHWNRSNMNQNRLNLGGSAQYTQSVLPWAVNDNDNFLSMDYATVAYTFAVHTARHLLDYETKTDKEIRKLKNRIKYLEKQLKSLHYEEANIVDN